VSSSGTSEWLPAALLEHADAWESKSAFDADRFSRAEQHAARARQGIDAVRHAGVDGIVGQCPLCGASSRFLSPAADAETPNLREGLICSGCGTNARTRAGLVLLQSLCPQREASIYITEQASAAYRWLHKRYRSVIGSEFERSPWRRMRLSRHLWASRILRYVRFEDVTALSLKTASQRAVVSFDVIEHVPDDQAAFREFARVTERAGWLILTAPFAGAERGIERAQVCADGSIEHLLAPEYHGDPLGKGVLCFRHYGWNLLDDLRSEGYSQAAVVMPWYPEAGLFDGLVTIVARR
jgi:hypothetical protein